jgi:hypothetical protein
MKHSLRSSGAVLLILVLFLSACSFPSAPAQPTKANPNAVLTAAAQTAQARLTELANTTPSPELATATSAPTQTQQPAQETITATLSASNETVTPGTPLATPSTPQATQPLATNPPAPTTGDRAEFVADVTIPDGTAVDAGAKFTKTWKLKNIGTTTWTTAYSLIRASNDAIQGPAKTTLTKEVPPGEMIEVSVDLTAPTTSGKHTGYFKLSNDKGQAFGIGPNADGAFYVQINVGGGTPAPTNTPSAGATAGPTSTPGSGSGPVVKNVSVNIENPTFTGACPHRYSVTATFTLTKSATVTYQLEGQSTTPGFQFSLPAAQSSSFAAGTQTLVFTLDFSSSGEGTIRLHITAPEDVASNSAAFSLTCQ